jgi:hypothetical protein
MKEIQLTSSQKLAKVALSSALALSLSFGVTLPSFANEYAPPPEAFEGVGGWAVVDPRTGEVYGVIVADWDQATWDQVKNTSDILNNGYMGCPSPCEFRFQTRATADGNVAGWHGTQTTIDEDGNARQTNNGSVRYDDASGNFEISNESPDGTKTKQTLVPGKTSRDADGKGRSMNLSSGIVDIRTSKEITSGDQSATVDTYKSNLDDQNLETTIALPGLGSDGTVLKYVFGNRSSADDLFSGLDQIKDDLVSILIGKGFTRTETLVDEETSEQNSSEVLDEENSFVASILNVAKEIANFLGSLLGWNQPSS